MTNRNALALLLIMLLGISCGTSKMTTSTDNTADNTLSASEQKAGWELLFDGNNLNKWHTYGKNSLEDGWKIADGAIFLDLDAGKGADGKRSGNNIVTNESYGDFEMKIDWKISPQGNSGIIFYVEEDAAQYHENYNTGMEMQVLDNGTPTRPGHPDGKLYTHRAGDLYDLLAAKEGFLNPQGEWNHVEVTSKNGQLDFYMNGTHTLSTTMWDDHWREMIGISKFKDMKNFGTFKQGKISLQDHGNMVYFKNIKIRKL